MNSKNTGLASGQVEGMKELSDKFKELANILSEPELFEAGYNVAKKIQARIRQKAPVKKGNLKKAIVAKKFKPGGKNFAFVATDYNIAPHAHLVEFGHGGPAPAPAHPFFRPVVDEFMHNGELENEIGKAVEKAIKKVANR